MRYLLVVFIIGLFCFGASAQDNIVTFGKNRINQKTYEWVSVSSEDAAIYYYGNNEALAKLLLNQVKDIVNGIEHKLEYRIGEQVHIFLYASPSDYNESN